MALQTSGQISLNDVNVELGNSGTAQIDMNSAAVRGLFGIASGEIEMADGYGKANTFSLVISSSTQEANLNTLATAAGWDGSTEVDVTVNSGVYLWSDNTSNPGLLVNIPCTITNYGNIIGRGGNGGQYALYGIPSYGAVAGGPAIKINSGVSGVTITNSSGAYIAGGGGGGGYGRYVRIGGDSRYGSGGGGGAGGGVGGGGFSVNDTYFFTPNDLRGSSNGLPNPIGGTGGAIGQAGQTPPNTIHRRRNYTPYQFMNSYGGYGVGGGGGAGGGGAGSSASLPGPGGGGGRILPGTGGAKSGSGGAGGAGGNAGANASTGGTGQYSGGGGGWGAAGGNGKSTQYANSTGFSYSYPAGGAGGKAVDDSGVSYTLSNSGTIYGAT